MTQPSRALFLDRDGTLIVDTGYVRDARDVVLLPGAAHLLREARALGYQLIVVSNQSGVARRIITPAQLAAVQERFEESLAQEGVALDDVRFCLHGPDDGCACRKPASGMLRDAAAARGLDLRRSVMVGDRETDVAAGRGAGCRTILLSADGASAIADYSVRTLFDAVPILQQLAAG